MEHTVLISMRKKNGFGYRPLIWRRQSNKLQRNRGKPGPAVQCSERAIKVMTFQMRPEWWEGVAMGSSKGIAFKQREWYTQKPWCETSMVCWRADKYVQLTRAQWWRERHGNIWQNRGQVIGEQARVSFCMWWENAGLFQLTTTQSTPLWEEQSLQANAKGNRKPRSLNTVACISVKGKRTVENTLIGEHSLETKKIRFANWMVKWDEVERVNVNRRILTWVTEWSVEQMWGGPRSWGQPRTLFLPHWV